jgi:hypothetical protein
MVGAIAVVMVQYFMTPQRSKAIDWNQHGFSDGDQILGHGVK